MKTKKLMKLLMIVPDVDRNKARRLVAQARKCGISNEEAYAAVVMEMLDYLNYLAGILKDIYNEGGGDEV